MTLLELDVPVRDGGSLHAYDTGADASSALTVVWHHGSPQTGAPIAPLLEAASARGIRLVSYGRPGYGGSTPRPGRDVASAAADVAAIADALGIERFAVMGASGGGPHALACAALLPGRVTGAVTLAGIAPRTDAFDWFAGMASPGGLRAAVEGRAARAAAAETEEFDPAQFLPVDWAALDGRWASLGADAQRAGEAGLDGLVDDDVALAAPWGVELGGIGVPVLLVQGEGDRVVPAKHASWLVAHIPRASLWMRLDDGHVSVLDVVPDAMDWLLERS
ncbi:alpha/beta fold hydrolase [Agromyces cerinus]|uniref:Pimeloyl-ACP methyl ester carboxylesterase n=1 Tax=Agromyces cerinus subsp. cerinus TaxID=232089 RepID=A0A1N6I303_9MICO|nr:alpha/beta hydrolase [Agromyces cerinus]SIO26402.1 Pimeloyl-ACP methyl ester carboxylesterase [Agromyces cerinus subsp. cerinus]